MAYGVKPAEQAAAAVPGVAPRVVAGAALPAAVAAAELAVAVEWSGAVSGPLAAPGALRL